MEPPRRAVCHAPAAQKRRGGRVLALTTLLGAVLSPELARADPDADAEAQTLFDEGRTLMKEGKFSEACPRLEKSQRLLRWVT